MVDLMVDLMEDLMVDLMVDLRMIVMVMHHILEMKGGVDQTPQLFSLMM